MSKKGDRKYERYCVICGKDLTGTRRIKTCDSEECIRANRLNNYKENLKQKECKYCNKTFLGRDKELLCEDCKGIKNITYRKMIQRVICPQCKKEIRKQFKNVTGNTVSKIYETCDTCKAENKKKNSLNASKRMKESNPMYNKDIAKKVGDTERQLYLKKCEKLGIIPKPRQVKNRKKETKEEAKIRMHEHNPMYNKKVRKRASETLKKHIKNGEIVYKKGSEHHLWKGNRTLAKHIRINLRKWVKWCFEKANYTCQKNGETKCELHVHHITPLRDIISSFLEKYKTNSQDILKDEKLLDKFTKEIIEYHFKHPEIGIVVCPNCHHKIDKYYRRLTYKIIKNEN